MIDFDEERHLYTVGGNITPSVTQIICHNKANFYKDNGADRVGTVVHRLLQDYDTGLDVDFYGDHYLGYLEQYREILSELQIGRFTHVEAKLYHEGLQYCGTVDRAINGVLVADIKTGTAVPAWAALQTAAYAMALYPKDYLSVKRMVFHINPKKLKKPKVKTYSDPADFKTWEALCSYYHKDMREREERK